MGGHRRFLVGLGTSENIFELKKGNKYERVEPMFSTQKKPVMYSTEFKVIPEFSSEIWGVIGKYMVFALLRNKMICEAWKSCLLNRTTMTSVYSKIFRGQKSTMLEKIDRLKHLFSLCYFMYDRVFLEENSEDTAIIAFSALVENATNDQTFYPWDIDIPSMSVEEIDPPQFTNGSSWVTRFIPAHASKSYGDIIWLEGWIYRGMLRAKRICRPVITFLLQDEDEKTCCITRNIVTRRYFGYYSDFYKFLFGPETTVFYVVDTYDWFFQHGWAEDDDIRRSIVTVMEV